MKSTRRGSFSVHRSEKNPRFERQLDKRPLSPEDAAVRGRAHIRGRSEGERGLGGLALGVGADDHALGDHLGKGEGSGGGLDVAEEIEGVALVNVAGAIGGEADAPREDQEGRQHESSDSLHHLCVSLILHARGGHGLDNVGLGDDEHRHRHQHHDEGDRGGNAGTGDAAGNQLAQHVGHGLEFLRVDEHAAGGAPHLLER